MREDCHQSFSRGVIQSFVEKHFPTGVEQSKSMSLFDLIPKSEEEKNRTNKKRKSTFRSTTKRSISCDSNDSSDDSDIECYSSFLQPNKRRSTKTKHRDQNNNHHHRPFEENHLSDHENSCESLLIEEDFTPFIPQQQHTFAEILGQTEMESGLPVQRIIPKKEVPTTNLQSCT